MPTWTRFLALLLTLGPISTAADAASPRPPKQLWRLDKGFETPESAYYDVVSDRIYVSSIKGDALSKDGQGWISTVKLDGTMDKEKWVEGFNAPKGIRIHDGKLWVTDIDEVIGIDVKTATITTRIKVSNATFLNDLTIADEGTIYVSDMLGQAIFEIQKDKTVVFLSGAECESPNGLYAEGGALRVVSWGVGLTEDFSTKGPGHMYTVDRKTKKKLPMTKPFGNLDGLEKREGKAGWLITDWMKGSVFAWTEKGKEPEPILTGLKGPADIGYVAKGKILLVPEMNANALVAYALEP